MRSGCPRCLPADATLFVAALSIAIALLIPLETITKFVNFGALTAFMLLNLSVFVYFFLKRKRRGIKGFFTYLVLPIVGFGIIAYVWHGFDTITFIFGFGWMIAGIILGAVKSRGYKEVAEALKDFENL